MANPWDEDYGSEAPAPSGAEPFSVTIGQPDPRIARQEARQEASDAREEVRLRLQIQAGQRAAEAAEAAAANRARGGRGEAGVKGLPISEGQKLEEDVRAYEYLKNSLDTFRPDYADNLFGGLENELQGYTGAIGTPGQRDWWANFRTADNVVRNSLFGASLTESEKAAYAATTITPTMSSKEVEANLQRRVALSKSALERRVSRLDASGYNKTTIGAALGDAVVEFPKYAQGEQGAGATEIATGTTRTETDPTATALIDRMIRAGANADEINQAVKLAFPTDSFAPVSQGGVTEFQKYLKQNPNYKGSTAEATRTIANDTSALSRFAASPLGTALATGANTASLGGAALLAGQDKFDALANENPLSALGGGAVGAIAGSGAIGRLGGSLASRLGLGNFASKLSPTVTGVARDATFGGIYSSNTGGDVLTGALAGGVGSLVGAKVAGGVANTVAPVVSPAIARLREAGIPLTIGQLAKGTGTPLGRAIGGIEDRATSIPFLGDVITGARQRGLEAFNRADIDAAVAPIQGRVTAGGQEGYAQAQQAVREAYDAALNPLRLQADDTFKQGVSELDPYFINNIVAPNVGPDGTITGEQLQTIRRLAGQEAKANQSAPGGIGVARQAHQLRGLTRELAERQQPELMAQYALADEAYAALKPVERATANAINTGGVYTPAQKGTALRVTDQSVGKSSTAAGQRPGTELQAAAQEILPSSVADSGTAARLMAGIGGGGAAATGLLTPQAAAALASPALLYTKPVQKVLEKLIAGDRNGAAKSAAALIRKNRGIFGTITAAGSADASN